MNHIKKITLLLTLTFIGTSGLWAAEPIATGEPGAPTANFTQNISAKAFDRATGTFYVATDTAVHGNVVADAGLGKYTITKAGPTDITFTSIGKFFTNTIPANIGTVGYNRHPSPLLGPIKSSTLGDILVGMTGVANGLAGASDNEKLFAYQVDHDYANAAAIPVTVQLASAAAPAAAPGANLITVAGADSSLKLATGKVILNDPLGLTGKAFVYVYPTAAVPGAAGSGVCSANINLTDGSINVGTPAPAVGGQVHYLGFGQAQPLSINNMGVGAAFGLLGQQAGAVGAGNGCWVNDLYWDDELKVLYAGLSVLNVGQGYSYALVKSNLDLATGALQPFTRVGGGASDAIEGLPHPAFDPLSIFAVYNNADNGKAVVRNIRGMQTSTGLKYLIINSRTINNTTLSLLSLNKSIYAVRVAKSGVGGDVATKGNVIRNKTSVETALGDGWTSANLGASMVGGANLPIFIDASYYVSDMEVVGDAVYVSLDIKPGEDIVAGHDDPAVFSSRALFDHEGIIIGWTPWERVFKSENNGYDAAGVAQASKDADTAKFVAVDGKTGVVWQVNGDGTVLAAHPTRVSAPKVVRRTAWTTTPANAAGTGLAARLNADLATGCTAVLDLPTGTPGLGAAPRGVNCDNSFALFGGDGKVVFAQTKYGNEFNETVDFNPAERYKSTNLPGAGYVRALGFSRDNRGGDNGYFFAGTDNGLYAWAVTVSGVGLLLAPDGIDNLGNAFFNPLTSSWQKMDFDTDKIIGAVTAIESNGTRLFVVEQGVAMEGAIVSKLHRVQIDADIGLMLPAGHHAIIAQSGTGAIPADTIFTGFALVSSDGDRAHSTGILATNAGFFYSDDFLGAAALTWTPLEATKAFPLIKSEKRSGNNDGIAFSALVAAFADAGDGCYQKHDIANLGINWTFPVDGTWTAAPAAPALKDYVNASAANGGNDLPYLDRLTAFWTDGGRRLFATYDPSTSGNTLKSMPFATTEWDMSGPETIAELADVNCINWIENISGIGVLMVGTDKGVATLE